MKIGLCDVDTREKNFFVSHLPRYHFEFLSSHLNSRTAGKFKHCDVVVFFINSRVDEKTLMQMPKLKLLVTLSTGYDHIDLAACKKRGILVTNVPTYGENTVAEQAFALLLCLSRKMIQAVARTHEDAFSHTGLTGFDLAGKTLGVVGVGHIGEHSVTIGKGFGMNVLGYARHPDKKLAEKLGFTYVSFEKLLKDSDVVTLHLPFTPETHHIMNTKTFSLMKKGAIFINTARGGLVDTAALVHALQTHHLGGAGLDVLEAEDTLQPQTSLKGPGIRAEWQEMYYNHKLLHMPNVVVTPHNAFNTLEAINRILLTGVTNIQAYAKRKPINLVTA